MANDTSRSEILLGEMINKMNVLKRSVIAPLTSCINVHMLKMMPAFIEYCVWNIANFSYEVKMVFQSFLVGV